MIEIGKGGHRKVESYRLSHHPHHPQKRDWIGLACWLFVSIVVGLLALPVMVGREIYQYQYRHYHLSRFEWEDVVRYTLVILLWEASSITSYKTIPAILTNSRDPYF